MSAESYRLAGNDAFRARDFSKALESYSNGLDVCDSNNSATLGMLYSNRAAVYLEMKNYAAALEDATSCTNVCPTNAKGHARKGAALWSVGRFAEAAAAYDEAAQFAANENASQASQYRQQAADARKATTPGGGGAGMNLSGMMGMPELALDLSIVVCTLLFVLGGFVGVGALFWKLALASVVGRYVLVLKSQGRLAQFWKAYRTDSGQYIIASLGLLFTTTGVESGGLMFFLASIATNAFFEAASKYRNVTGRLPLFSHFNNLEQQKQHAVLLNGAAMQIISAFMLAFSFLIFSFLGGNRIPLAAVFLVGSVVRHRNSPAAEDKTTMSQATYALRVSANKVVYHPSCPPIVAVVWEKFISLISTYCSA
eukprot:PhM_4_TR7816/c0_g1_i1/m.14783